jgi:hypothetical protein
VVPLCTAELLNLIETDGAAVPDERALCWRRMATTSFEICDLLVYYRPLSGSYAPTFRDRLSVPSSSIKKSVTL